MKLLGRKGPGGRGRRLGTEVIGDTKYNRLPEKREARREARMDADEAVGEAARLWQGFFADGFYGIFPLAFIVDTIDVLSRKTGYILTKKEGLILNGKKRDVAIDVAAAEKPIRLYELSGGFYQIPWLNCDVKNPDGLEQFVRGEFIKTRARRYFLNTGFMKRALLFDIFPSRAASGNIVVEEQTYQIFPSASFEKNEEGKKFLKEFYEWHQRFDLLMRQP